MNFKITHLGCIILALVALVIAKPVSANAKFELSTKEINLFDNVAKRPAKVKFWYQADKNVCDAQICLQPQQNIQKIAVISHGAFGSPRSMNWLGYALASQGWVVAGVAHFGESWIYGSQTIDPSVLQRFWQRPQEVSFVLDSISKKGLFNRKLIVDEVLMLGHSAGGFTSLAMAGALLEAGKSEAYCLSPQSKGDKGCNYSATKSTKPLSENMLKNIGTLQAKMRDERITAVIALDPALGHAVSDKSLANIKVPTLILGSVENDFLPFTAHAKYYADFIPNARLVGVEQGAGHFVYIDSCDNERKVKGVALCHDRQGVDRKDIQQQLLNQVFRFINEQRS